MGKIYLSKSGKNILKQTQIKSTQATLQAKSTQAESAQEKST